MNRRMRLCLLSSIAVGLLVYAYTTRPPVGNEIPSSDPVETRRYTHPSGYSMVFPPNWTVAIGDDSELALNYLSASPVQLRRWAARLDATPIPNDYTFVNETPTDDLLIGETRCPATTWSVPGVLFDEPPRFSYRCVYDDGQRRFLLTYSTPHDLDGIPDTVLAYLRTFRPK